MYRLLSVFEFLSSFPHFSRVFFAFPHFHRDFTHTDAQKPRSGNCCSCVLSETDAKGRKKAGTPHHAAHQPFSFFNFPLRSQMRGSGNDGILHRLVKLCEIRHVSGHPHQNIPVIFRIFLGRPQGFRPGFESDILLSAY